MSIMTTPVQSAFTSYFLRSNDFSLFEYEGYLISSLKQLILILWSYPIGNLLIFTNRSGYNRCIT